MMKTLGRIGLILGAALIVVGLTLVAVQLGWAQSLPLGRGERGEPGRPELGEAYPEGQAAFGGDRDRDEQRLPSSDEFGGPLEGHEGRFQGGASGLSELFRNTLIVGVIVTVVAALSLAATGLRKVLRRKPAIAAQLSSQGGDPD